MALVVTKFYILYKSSASVSYPLHMKVQNI